ncbi:MAG: hypothetical protein ACKOJF_06375, partial [Planctomycetaceae bacterium]
ALRHPRPLTAGEANRSCVGGGRLAVGSSEGGTGVGENEPPGGVVASDRRGVNPQAGPPPSQQRDA